MSNVVNFEQYRNLKHLLETDPDFRAFVEGLLRELDAAKDPWYQTWNPVSPYTVSRLTFNGQDVTDKS
jgi:hypothetical protein